MTGPARRLRDLPVAPALLSMVVVGSVMAVGTVHVHVLLSVSAVAIAGAALVLWIGRRDVGALPAPSWILLGLAGWSALQAAPLPMGVLATIAPKNADVWARSLRPFGESAPAFASISLDPGASLVESLKWATYAAVFALAYSAGKRDGRYWGPVIVFFSAVAVALVTLVHGLVGAKSLFGIYTPVQAVPRWGLPPLLNPNNLSGYLNLGVFCGAGLVLTHRSDEPERPLPPDWSVSAGIACVVGISVLAASRAGVLSLGAGAIALALLVRLARSGRRRRNSGGLPGRRRIAAVASALLGGGLLAALGASESTWEELMGTGAEKLRLVSWSTPLLADHPWFGVGRGAFETAFPAYRGTGGHTLFAHPENFLVQWAAEWGLPASAGGLLLLGWFLRPSRLAVRESRAALGVLVGGAALLLQNLADLALEVPGVVIALAAAAGSIYQGVPAERESSGRASPWKRRLPALAVAGTGSLAWLVAASHGRHPVQAEREVLHAAFRANKFADSAAWAQFSESLRSAIRRHPAEAYFPLLGALAARRTPGVDPMPWIGAALERDPKSGETHLVLSDILARRGARGQALMELRLAVEREPQLADIAGQRAVALSRKQADLLQVVPEGEVGARVLLAVAVNLREPSDWQLRAGFFDAALARDSGLAGARIGKADDLVDALEKGAAPCAGDAAEQCHVAAAEQVRALGHIDPLSCEVPVLSARLLVVRRKEVDALVLLEDGCSRCREARRCQQFRLSVAARSAGLAGFKDAARALLATACGEPRACSDAHAWVALHHAQRGEWSGAADHFARALQGGHESADLWVQLAEASARGGDPRRARSALRQAERLGKVDPGLAKRIDELENSHSGRP